MKPVRRMAAKPKPDRKPKAPDLSPRELAVLTLQQTFLDTLEEHFSDIWNEKTYDKKLQAIKGHFFRREFSQVFGNPEYCIIYAVRYLPSRALAYTDLFRRTAILDLLYPPPVPRRPSESKPPLQHSRKRIVAVGAGVGSELCALHLLPQIRMQEIDADEEDMLELLQQDLEIDVIDSAEYGEFLTSLNTTLHERKRLANGENMASVRFHYHKQDILSYCRDPEFAKLLSETTLLTFMFVFNELFAASKLLTMQLIAAVAENLQKGSHVLLIESAGDLSQVKIGPATAGTTQQQVKFEAERLQEEEESKGMMVYKFWDHLPGFEPVLNEDRKWFRLNPTLHYALELENVGYFVRLYRKVS